jgi:hypothetical protein
MWFVVLAARGSWNDVQFVVFVMAAWTSLVGMSQLLEPGDERDGRGA